MKTFLTFLVLVLVVFVGTVQADLSNVRPVSFGASWDGTSLQNVLDGITTSGHIDAVNDQIDAAVFTNTGSGGAIATFAIEISGNAGQNIFGLYDYFNPNNKAPIFSGADTQGAQKWISFMANGDIRVNGLKVSTFNPADMFGFYLHGPGGTFYTEDSLNGGNPQAVIIRGGKGASIQIPDYNGGQFTADEFIVAFDDLPWAGTTDRDFQDLVVVVESISPAIPAPGAMILGTIGLGLVGWIKRRYL